MFEFLGLATPEILDLLETLVTVVALVFTIKTIRDNTRSNQTKFRNEVYDNFQDLQLAILDNPSTLQILAKANGKTENETRRNSLAAVLINNAYRIFLLHTSKQTPKNFGVRFQKDMEDLFTLKFIHDRWLVMRTLFPLEFQQFIDECLLERRM